MRIFATALVVSVCICATAQAAEVSERNVRAQMEFLAGDAMQGRGSGTLFERVAAEYVASQFKQFGLEPVNGEYVQTITVPGRNVLDVLTLEGALKEARLNDNIAALSVASETVRGPLQKLRITDTPAKGAVVFVDLPANAESREFFRPVKALFDNGATAVILNAPDYLVRNWSEVIANPLEKDDSMNLFLAKDDFAKAISALPDGVEMGCQRGP